ncbi:hypothetical protein APHAL10511_000620 [Amanita phalloides]|nr:hypothetical protein APHAL10511_000620 [Amanita phalloides]
MVLKLYGMDRSTSTQSVAVILHEKKVPFEFIPVDLRKREHKSEDYLEMHPFGQVPVLDDNGFLLYESRAIALYIINIYANQGTPLIPVDPKGRALLAQAQSIEICNFDPHASGIVWEKLFKPRFIGLPPDETALAKHVKNLDTKLDGYERILSKQKYLAGDELTHADLFHLPYGTLIYEAGYGDLIDKRPSVKKWFEELRQRDSWLAVKDGVKGTA